MTRVRFVASDTQGGGRIRSYWPAVVLDTDPNFEATADVWYPNTATGYDTIIIHRPLDAMVPDAIKQYQSQGARVIVDEDDDFDHFDQTKNEVGHEVWAKCQWQHDVSLQLADLVTCSTPTLANVYSRLNKTAVCRNYLPSGVLEIHRPLRGKVPLVGYAGIVKTHRHDLEWLTPWTDKMLKGALFTSIGDPLVASILGANSNLERLFPFSNDPLTLYSVMSRADIGIVPLLPCEFNESKSWLKALEYMSLGIPVVATKLTEQEALIEHGVTGFLADTPLEFADYVQELVHNPDMREQMGLAAKEKARTMTLETNYRCWVDVACPVGADV